MNDASPPTARPRRRRRSQREILDRLTRAARDEFSELGYARATTAGIARRADVVEALIFKHFGSKARLFEDAVFKPLNDHFVAFNTANAQRVAEDPDTEGEARRYVAELHAFLGEHARMLLSFAVEQAYRDADEGHGDRIDGLDAYFERASTLGAHLFDDDDPATPMLMARISFASMLACAIFKDWLLPATIAPEAKVRAAVSDFVFRGIDSRRGASGRRPA